MNLQINKMKKIYLLFLLLIFTLVPVVAQEKGGLTPEKRKEYREYKMKFLAQEMGLKSDLRKEFYNVYNQLSDERFPIRKEIREIDKKIKNNTASEQDYASLNRLREQEAEIEKRYDARFSSFLSSKEIFKMKEAENIFRKKLHEVMKKKGNKK